MRQEFRVFVASPGDVQSERESLGKAIVEVNQTHGQPLGYLLDLVQWKSHAVPDAKPPQSAINDQLGDYDIFIGIMWRRFGTPTGVAGSGTEEEIRRAYRRWEEDERLPVMLYFSQKQFMPANVDENDQMRKVLLLRQELSGKSLVWEYQGPEVFEETIRKHLCLRMSRIMNDKTRSTSQTKSSNDKTSALLHESWSHMTPDLQNALSIAHNENRMAGDGGIKTEDLFAALRRIGSPQLQAIIKDIPKQALPRPTKGTVIDKPYLLEEQPWLSHCVASSIRRLTRRAGTKKQIAATDIFVDIAKHGSGKSVSLLRKHGIGPEQIDKIVTHHKIKVLNA
ncbi:MAG: DUF4062 domain-containing protein [Nitrospira defluvii]|nr:DUF4062 domain-containing protein [Nitrospira defluvii]